jgi:hypothetical protein
MNGSATARIAGFVHVGHVPAPWQSGQAGGSAPQCTHRAELDGVRLLHTGHTTRDISHPQAKPR